MKIFLPFKIKNIGGTTTFAKKFKEGMERYGHEVFFEYRSDYDIIFMIVQAPFKYLLDAKRRKKKIIQRLDGTYYWSTVGPKYFLYNLKAKIIRHLISDFTIYQSEFSKISARKFLGSKINENSMTIYNGVDLDIFSPLGEKIQLRDNPQQKIFFTASAFRRDEQLIPILDALKIYAKKYDNNFKFIVAGTFTPEVGFILKRYSDFENFQFIGRIDNSFLPKYERSSDVFLFTQLNPPCPNSILEALACGLPICGIADGAMPELVDNGRNGLLASVSGNAFWKKRKYDPETFADNLYHIVINHRSFSEKARQSSLERFSLDKMIGSYIETLERTCKKNSLNNI